MFGNKYKEAYEEQKRLTDKAIKSAEGWKGLCEEATVSYERAIKDLETATAMIGRLQTDNNRLVLEVALWRLMLW